VLAAVSCICRLIQIHGQFRAPAANHLYDVGGRQRC
jgi:hypothetical protein